MVTLHSLADVQYSPPSCAVASQRSEGEGMGVAQSSNGLDTNHSVTQTALT